MLRSARHLATRLATYGLLAAVATACAGQDATDDGVEDGFVVPDGKADDFLSLKAREYIVHGTARVVAEEGATEARVRQLVGLHHTAVTWFLNQYLTDKEKEGAHPDPNADYGGFSAMVKDGSTETIKLTQRNATTWDYEFDELIAGRRDLMQRLPLNASNEFTVEIGKPTNDEMEHDAEWYRAEPWEDWNPDAVPAYQKEPLTLSIRPETKSSDGWWDYKRLLDDGVLTVDAHFGWDYNTPGMHLTDSKAFYEWLVDRGFHSPVSTWDKYKRTSGPLTKTIEADGEQVKIAVRIFYPRPGTETDPDTDDGGRILEADLRESLKTRDVIVYAGHSGALYGFSMANWDKTAEGDLDDSELATAELARGKYQIVFAEACNTYMLGNTLKHNPNKQGKDIDVITSTNMSVSYSPVEDFLARLIEIDSQGRLRPRTVSATIADLDLYTYGSTQPTMYGIHGIDDNPKLHPFANPENACKACSSNAACGGVGNSCVSIGDSGRRCVAACTDDAACGEGYRCREVASASTSTIYGKYCVPTANRCE